MPQNNCCNKIVFPADEYYLPVVRNFISCLGKTFLLTKCEINALKLSVDEACSNIIKHGYPKNQPGFITLKFFIENGAFVIELHDQGKSFNPGLINDPNLTDYVENRKKGGLGIYMMKTLLDIIEYETNSMKNILRLVKIRKQDSLFYKS